MEISTIISIVTIFLTFVCGLIAKKISWFNNKLIPIQNLSIGIIAGIIHYIITDDFNLVIVTVGLGTGGAYDILNNFKKILSKEGEYEGDRCKFISRVN